MKLILLQHLFLFSDKMVKWMTRAQFLVEIFQFAIILLQYVSITKLAICYANYANIGSEFYFIVSFQVLAFYILLK